MKNRTRENLIRAALENHVGIAEGATWWGITEVRGFSGDRDFIICDNKGNEYTLTTRQGNAIILKS